MKKFTSAAEVKFVSLATFIKAIPIYSVTVNNGFVEYHESLGSTPIVFGVENIGSFENKYRCRQADITARASLERDFIEALSFSLVMKPDNFLFELEDRTVEQVVEYGVPTHAVMVGQRTWCVASPDDFIIFQDRLDSDKMRLICLHPYRNTIYKYRTQDVTDFYKNAEHES